MRQPWENTLHPAPLFRASAFFVRPLPPLLVENINIFHKGAGCRHCRYFSGNQQRKGGYVKYQLSKGNHALLVCHTMTSEWSWCCVRNKTPSVYSLTSQEPCQGREESYVDAGQSQLKVKTWYTHRNRGLCTSPFTQSKYIINHNNKQYLRM